jgi:hypothetical protein
MIRGGTLAAAGVVLLTNAVALLEVAHNRRGGPVETIRLTERELPVNYRENEDSGVSVRLQGGAPYPVTVDNYAWLDRAKLQSLGFDPDRALRDPKRQPLPRLAFIVFEYDGPAWERWLKAAQESKPRLTASGMTSRLIPIDAAVSADPLLRKYSDPQRYLVVRGLVQVFVGDKQIHPSVSQILPDAIHVPAPLSEAIGPFAGSSDTGSRRYTLTLAYGRDFEPWLVTEAGGK